MTDHIKRHDDGKFARHTHSTGGDLAAGSIHPSQAELAIVCYEPGTNDAEKVRFARIAISEHPYSFENVGQDAGEALDHHIQDDAVVLKALDASGDEVSENPSDFGQILAEQIFDDVNEAEQAKWSAAYHSTAARPSGHAGMGSHDSNGRWKPGPMRAAESSISLTDPTPEVRKRPGAPGVGNLDGYDKRPPAGLVNISRRVSPDEDSEQFDGPYDVRDPKHPGYTDRSLSFGRGSHDSRGRWSPGPMAAVSTISLSRDDLGKGQPAAEQQARPPAGVNISLPEFPEDAFAENVARAKAEDEAREKSLAEEGERYREQVRLTSSPPSRTGIPSPC